jgi:hypothetical protein
MLSAEPDTPCVFPFLHDGQFHTQCKVLSDGTEVCPTAVDSRDWIQQIENRSLAGFRYLCHLLRFDLTNRIFEYLTKIL